MNSGPVAERGIDITLTVERECIVEVAIANHRPLGIASHLTGLDPENACRRVASVFSVCRIAQGVAGSMAVERALGIEPAPCQKAARAFLLRGETVLEHATCALLTWPALVAQIPVGISIVKALRGALAELWRCVYPRGDWMLPGGGWLAPDKTALAASLATAEATLKEAGLALPLDIAGWRDWLSNARGPAAELLRMLKARDWAGCGASRVPLLDSLDETAIEQNLAADMDGTFVARPEWEGVVWETGPLARRMAEPVIREAVAEHGRGLTARFLAQCVETVRCLGEMQEIAGEICKDEGTPVTVRDGEGLGRVRAARGWLAHRVEISGERISRYQILAPTEWNFHPSGALARGLVQGRPGPPPQRLAQLMFAAIDPCVPCQIKVRSQAEREL